MRNSLFAAFTTRLVLPSLLLALSIQGVCAAALDAPVLTGGVLLTSERGATMQPQAMAPTADGGMVIAGGIEATRQAWATSVDAAGQTRWSYYRSLDEKPDYPFGSHPDYRAVVPMPDGSVYLCGDMRPARAGKKIKALLTHIDAAGKVLDEQIIAPQTGESIQVDSCVAWRGGILVRGAPPSFGPGSNWLLFVDGSGRRQWERVVSPTSDSPRPSSGTVLLPERDQLVIGTSDNTKSEFIRIGPDGQVLARKSVDGRFVLAQAVVPDSLLQAFGWSADGPRIVLTLDDHLNEVRRTVGSSSHFVPQFVYRLPDESLVELGELVGAPFHPRFVSGVAHVDKDLRTERILSINDSGFEDGGHVFAGTAIALPGQFALATRLAATAASSTSARRPTAGFVRGAVLRFVRLQ
jgi:hypothetical protein